MCDVQTIDHSKTLLQEECPSLSSGAVGLDRSPMHSWSLATSQLCGWEHFLHLRGYLADWSSWLVLLGPVQRDQGASLPWLICPFSSTSASPASQAPGCSFTCLCPPASTKLSLLLLLFLLPLVPYQVLSLGCYWGQAECSAPCEVLKGSRKPGRGGSCNAEPCLRLSLPLHTSSRAPFLVSAPTSSEISPI